MTRGRGLWAASLLVTGALASAARPASAETLTLAEVEARAQRERPELLERRASIDRANAELAGVRSRSGPTLGARGDISLAPGSKLLRIPYDDAQWFVAGTPALGQEGALVPRARYAAILAGKYTLLDFGRTSLGVRAAEAAISAERASLIQAKVELVRAARGAYLTWLEAQQTWQLAQSDAAVTTARTKNVRELIGEGARPATDATLSAYDELLAKLREARARRASNMAFEALAAAVQSELPQAAEPELGVIEMGVPAAPGASEGATPGPSSAGPPGPEAAAHDQRVQALERKRAAALSAANAADRSRAPQLDVSAELGVQGQDSQVFPAYRAGLSLSVPLYDGGMQSALADEHRAEALGLEARRQLLERQLTTQRRAAEHALASAGEELALSLTLLDTAQSLLAQAEEHYRTGSDTLERVLNAQRSLVQARREVLTSKLENAKARLELVPVQLRD